MCSIFINIHLYISINMVTIFTLKNYAHSNPQKLQIHQWTQMHLPSWPKSTPLNLNVFLRSLTVITIILQSPHQVSKNHTILTKIHAFDKKHPITCPKSSPLPYFLLIYPNQNTNKTDENMDQITPLHFYYITIIK